VDTELEARLNSLMSYIEDLEINMNSYFFDSGYSDIVNGDIRGKLRAFKGYLKTLKFDGLVAELENLSIDEDGIVEVVETFREFIIPETRRLIAQTKSMQQQTYAPDVAQIIQTPFLSEDDIANACKVSELYIILHCYENSVRRLVEQVLSSQLGQDWWEIAANQHMKNMMETRRQTEQRKRWLSPRGQMSPLYYVEWGDLVRLIRKHEEFFLPYISELRFIESRFEDLESLRNIIAHHGMLPSDDDFHRIVISFRDWCRQVGNP
jgi:hypothetical protein